LSDTAPISRRKSEPRTGGRAACDRPGNPGAGTPRAPRGLAGAVPAPRAGGATDARQGVERASRLHAEGNGSRLDRRVRGRVLARQIGQWDPRAKGGGGPKGTRMVVGHELTFEVTGFAVRP